MKPRHAILREPHMQHLVDLPALRALDDDALRQIDPFFAFCAAHAVSDLAEGDYLAYATLAKVSATELDALRIALEGLGLTGGILAPLKAARIERDRRETIKITPTGPLATPRARRFSVPVAAMPADWQATFARLRAGSAFAPSILDRMEQRLGMFVWSAQKAGLPIDLACPEARAALTEDVTARSAAKNGGVHRIAYLRGAWEEMTRFARAHGCDEATVAALRGGREQLARREAVQSALKMGKVAVAGSASALLAAAWAKLAQAAETSNAHRRHDMRNDAAAVALGVAVPARPGDVERHHIFGVGIFYEADTARYRFRYVPGKTKDSGNASLRLPINLLLLPDYSRFIDALVLGDLPAKYLPSLRDAAFANKRPLYIRYDEAPCPLTSYSRGWKKMAGTGGQIARTLAYDEFAAGVTNDEDPTGRTASSEFAVAYGKTVNHHASDTIPRKYRSEISLRREAEAAQRILAVRALRLGPPEEEGET